jgi:hypothetical protein
MSRWKAAAIHLSISAAIGLVVGALLLLVWYPPPYFHAAGADQLVLLLVGVDLVLGPLLTLVLFRSGKKGLKFDLAMIAVLQTTALVYGLSVVLQSRPVFLVSAVDRFVLVSANEIDPEDLAKGSKPEFRSLSLTGPRLAGTAMPKSWQERNKVLFSGVAGKDIEEYPQYYVNYREAAPGLLERAKPLERLVLSTDEERSLLEDGIARTGKARDALVFVPLVARKANLTMLLDARNGDPLQAIAVNPWGNAKIKQLRHASKTPRKP